MKMLIKQAVAAFLRDEDASLTVEAVLILPILVWWYAASLVFFDAYDARNVNLKAAYTVSDMLSREMDEVNAGYIEGLSDVFEYLTAGHGTNGAIRVTLVRCHSDCDKDTRVLKKDWSYGTNGKTALVDANMDNYQDDVPIMPQGDRVIMVETWMDYSAAFDVGLTTESFENIVITRPRFVPQLVWESS